MSKNKVSETVTENIFREFYGPQTFIEKSAIPTSYGFSSKKETGYKGFPDFFKDEVDYAIIVEAKSLKHSDAEKEVQFYMNNNNIKKDIIGIAISGQHLNQIKVTYFYKIAEQDEIKEFLTKDTLLSLSETKKMFNKNKYGETITSENLVKTLKKLNETLHAGKKIRDTDRSLFFSGIMIALTNNNFRSTYKNIQPPSREELSSTKAVILESHNLNKNIIDAIDNQLKNKINNLSKEYSWKDKFSFIKNIDYPLEDYKEIIIDIENNIFQPYINEEKQDILGQAYKIFLSRAGKIDNKNIILTPDHIKRLMVKLSRLSISDIVLDTCTGSGGFLMESMETLIRLANGNPSKIESIKANQLIGFEIDSTLFALACSNMFLHGDGRTNLLYRSSLLNNDKEAILNNTDDDLLRYIKSLKPTKCIINPPYENNNSIKFTKQALEYLEPNGKLIVIMPTPTLTKNQNGMTEEILKTAKLDFVIKMPKTLFSEQKRTVNTSIFGFTKTPHSKSDEVLFYNLEDDGFVSVQHKGRIDKNKKWDDIENTILDAINNSKEIKGICEKRKIYHKDTLNCAGIQKKRIGNNMVKLGTLFKIENGSLQSSKCNDSGEFDFITASKEWKKHDKYEHDKEAIIFAAKASGSLGQCHHVNGKFIASDLCFILTPQINSEYEVNLEFYTYYFNSIKNQLVSDLAEGTSKLTIDDVLLSEYYIDYIPIEKQLNFIDTVGKKHRLAQKNLEKIEKELSIKIKKIV